MFVEGGRICLHIPGTAQEISFWVSGRKCYIDGMEQTQYIRRPQLAARGVRHLESWRLLLAFFLDRAESNVRPSGRAAARSLPSFIAMLLKRGEGSVFPSWRLLLAFFFDRSESNIRPSDRAAAKPSVLHCHAVKAWRRIRFSELAAEKATLGLLTGQRREAFCPSPCCYSMARRRVRFSELAAALGILLQPFRKQR